jgi:hypothetical protein
LFLLAWLYVAKLTLSATLKEYYYKNIIITDYIFIIKRGKLLPYQNRFLCWLSNRGGGSISGNLSDSQHKKRLAVGRLKTGFLQKFRRSFSARSTG